MGSKFYLGVSGRALLGGRHGSVPQEVTWAGSLGQGSHLCRDGSGGSSRVAQREQLGRNASPSALADRARELQ